MTSELKEAALEVQRLGAGDFESQLAARAVAIERGEIAAHSPPVVALVARRLRELYPRTAARHRVEREWQLSIANDPMLERLLALHPVRALFRVVPAGAECGLSKLANLPPRVSFSRLVYALERVERGERSRAASVDIAVQHGVRVDPYEARARLRRQALRWELGSAPENAPQGRLGSLPRHGRGRPRGAEGERTRRRREDLYERICALPEQEQDDIMLDGPGAIIVSEHATRFKLGRSAAYEDARAVRRELSRHRGYLTRWAEAALSGDAASAKREWRRARRFERHVLR